MSHRTLLALSLLAVPLASGCAGLFGQAAKEAAPTGLATATDELSQGDTLGQLGEVGRSAEAHDAAANVGHAVAQGFVAGLAGGSVPTTQPAGVDAAADGATGHGVALNDALGSALRPARFWGVALVGGAALLWAGTVGALVYVGLSIRAAGGVAPNASASGNGHARAPARVERSEN